MESVVFPLQSAFATAYHHLLVAFALLRGRLNDPREGHQEVPVGLPFCVVLAAFRWYNVDTIDALSALHEVHVDVRKWAGAWALCAVYELK